MEKVIVNSYEEFAAFEGKVIGTSEWVEVSQERINMFADATLDHQWIHVDQERAAAGPLGRPSPTATSRSRSCRTCGTKSFR